MTAEDLSGKGSSVVKEFESGLLDRLKQIEETATGVIRSQKDDLEELPFLKDDLAFVTGFSELLSPVQSQYTDLREWAEKSMAGATESEKKEMRSLLLRDCGAIANARHLESSHFRRHFNGSDQAKWVLEPEQVKSLGLYTTRYGKPDKLASIESYEEYEEEKKEREGNNAGTAAITRPSTTEDDTQREQSTENMVTATGHTDQPETHTSEPFEPTDVSSRSSSTSSTSSSSSAGSGGDACSNSAIAAHLLKITCGEGPKAFTSLSAGDQGHREKMWLEALQSLTRTVASFGSSSR